MSQPVLPQHDLRQAILNGQMGTYQWLVVVLAVLLNMLDGFDVLAVAFTAKSIQGELQLNGTQIGTLMSAGLLGMALGSLLLAPLADKFGRRPLLIVSTALSATGMLMTYYAYSAQSIAIWRVVTGLGVGGILPCTNVIVSEYANRKWRGLAIAIYASGFGIGAMIGGISAVSLQDAYGWRAVFAAGAVLTAVALAMLIIWLPESVDFLMTKRVHNAAQRLKTIAQKIGKNGEWHTAPAADAPKVTLPWFTLLSPKYRYTTLLIWLAFVATMFSFYFVSSWTPALLEQAGMAKEKSQTVGMAISLGGAFGSLLFGFLVSRWRVTVVLITFTVLSAVSILLFVASSAALVPALIFAVLVGSLMNGCITGLYTINPTLYAADFRSSGAGTAIGIGRIGSIVSPIVAGILLDAGWQKNDLYMATAFVILIAGVAVWLLPRSK